MIAPRKVKFDQDYYFATCQYVKDKFDGTELGEKRLNVSKR